MEPRPVDREMAALLTHHRWAALALVGDDGPAVSMVAYAVDAASGGIVLFLSGLASHTRLLLERGKAALAVTAPDLGTGDPQELPRLTLECGAQPINRSDEGFLPAWSVYVERFPAAAPRLALADFTLFHLSPTAGRFVGGFARAMDADPARLAAAVGSLQQG